MRTLDITTLDLVEGGNVIKQGHHFTQGFRPRDAKGAPVDLTGLAIDVVIFNKRGVIYETTATFSDGLIRYRVTENIGNGTVWVEFTVTDPQDATYREKFPANEMDAKLKLVASADDIDFVGVRGSTVAQLRGEQQALQQAYEVEVDGKIETFIVESEELKAEFNAAMGALTQDSEVVTARKQFGTLGERLDDTAAQLAEMALPKSNGVDDTEMINTALQNKGVVRGLPGEEYLISASLVIPSNTRLDVSDCKVKWKPGVSGDALITNSAFTPQRTFSDASTTLGSNTLTSATAAFTSADIGRSVCVPGAGGVVGSPTMFTADIIEILSATSVRLGKSAKNTVSNANARIHNRDKNISVKGGIWDRGNAVGASGQRLHGLNFRHIENLTVDIESYRSTQHGAKYAFLLGNARHSKVSCRYMDTISDGVHLNGPCSFIDIPFLGGKTGDDFISLTGADYPHYADTAGDITDVNVGTIMIDDALAGYKILAGQGNYIDNFTAGNAYGSTRSYAAWVGTDENYPDTMGGSYGKIDMGSIFIHASADLLRIVDTTADIIKVKPKGRASIQLVRVLENTSQVGGVINNLIIEEANIPNNRVLFLKEGANSIVKRVTISKAFGDGTGYFSNIVGGVIEDFTIEKSSLFFSGAYAPIALAGGIVNHLKLIDTDVDVSNSGGVGALIQRTTGAGVKKITLSRGSLKGAGSVKGLIGFNPSNEPFEVVLDQVQLLTLKRLFDGLSSDLNLTLANPQINTALEPLHIGNASLKTTITGTLAALTGATTFLSSTSVGTIRVNGFTIPVRASLLTPVEGDQVRNTDASANSGWYTGVVAWDGGKWIPVRGYALSGNATLQSGSATVSYNRITATSRIRLFRNSTSGTAGSLYVEAINAGVGFTIKSTNTGDLSSVRYEVVAH